MQEEKDHQLVQRLRGGERGAFDEAYAQYKDRIYAFLLRLSGRRDVADDLYQETFLKLARFAHALREDTDLGAWLFTVARNAYRSQRRWAALDLSRLVTFGDDATYLDSEPTPDALADGARRLRTAETALSRLSPASREALLLVGVEGLDQERAATITGVTYAAFRQRLARARGELAQEMEILERLPIRRGKDPHAVSR